MGGRCCDTVVDVLNGSGERWRSEPCVGLLSFSAVRPHKCLVTRSSSSLDVIFCSAFTLEGRHLLSVCQHFLHWFTRLQTWISIICVLSRSLALCLSPSFFFWFQGGNVSNYSSQCNVLKPQQIKGECCVSLLFTWFVVPLNVSLRKGWTLCMAMHFSCFFI